MPLLIGGAWGGLGVLLVTSLFVTRDRRTSIERAAAAFVSCFIAGVLLGMLVEGGLAAAAAV